jgi:hypothetical protein
MTKDVLLAGLWCTLAWATPSAAVAVALCSTAAVHLVVAGLGFGCRELAGMGARILHLARVTKDLLLVSLWCTLAWATPSTAVAVALTSTAAAHLVVTGLGVLGRRLATSSVGGGEVVHATGGGLNSLLTASLHREQHT